MIVISPTSPLSHQHTYTLRPLAKSSLKPFTSHIRAVAFHGKHAAGTSHDNVCRVGIVDNLVLAHPGDARGAKHPLVRRHAHWDAVSGIQDRKPVSDIAPVEFRGGRRSPPCHGDTEAKNTLTGYGKQHTSRSESFPGT